MKADHTDPESFSDRRTRAIPKRVFKKFFPSRACEEVVLLDDQKTAPSRSRLGKKTDFVTHTKKVNE
jgi:hypothetical protein